jgi:acyl-CoA thioester hydrolase
VRVVIDVAETRENALIEAHCRVVPGWVDRNGHMHDSCYVEAFNEGVGQLMEQLGLGEAARAQGRSVFNRSMHIDYLRELFEGDALRITLQLIDWDRKHLHVFMRLYNAGTGVLSATNERLVVHVDLAARRSTPFPEETSARIDAIARAHAALGLPEEAGRRIAILRRGN